MKALEGTQADKRALWLQLGICLSFLLLFSGFSGSPFSLCFLEL
jgi:hypothetical protein